MILEHRLRRAVPAGIAIAALAVAMLMALSLDRAYADNHEEDENGELAVATAVLLDGFLGVEFETVLEATGGTGEYTWSLADGALPTGLDLSEDGIISGTPTEAGPFEFTVEVDDGESTATGTLSMAIIDDEEDENGEEPGSGFSEEPTPGGVTLTTYTGSFAQLQADGDAHNLVSVWATVGGAFVGYAFGAPDFANAEFIELFSAGLEAEGLVAVAN